MAIFLRSPRLILKYGLDKCVNQGFVTLTYNPQSDTLQFEYHEGTGLDAWAVLRRAKWDLTWLVTAHSRPFVCPPLAA